MNRELFLVPPEDRVTRVGFVREREEDYSWIAEFVYEKNLPLDVVGKTMLDVLDEYVVDRPMVNSSRLKLDGKVQKSNSTRFWEKPSFILGSQMLHQGLLKEAYLYRLDGVWEAFSIVSNYEEWWTVLE